MSITQDFTDFITKGNVLDLAVAFVMGAAFNAVVTALVTDIITPIIGIPGHVNLSSITFTINGSTVLLGSFLNAIIVFLSIAVAVFFFVVKPALKIQKMRNMGKKVDPTTKVCKYCQSAIPIKATRCPFCTSHLKK